MQYNIIDLVKRECLCVVDYIPLYFGLLSFFIELKLKRKPRYQYSEGSVTDNVFPSCYSKYI